VSAPRARWHCGDGKRARDIADASRILSQLAAEYVETETGKRSDRPDIPRSSGWAAKWRSRAAIRVLVIPTTNLHDLERTVLLAPALNHLNCVGKSIDDACRSCRGTPRHLLWEAGGLTGIDEVPARARCNPRSASATASCAAISESFIGASPLVEISSSSGGDAAPRLCPEQQGGEGRGGSSLVPKLSTGATRAGRGCGRG
jgi:hypothetical protein